LRRSLTSPPNLLRHPGLRSEPVRHPRSRALLAQAAHPSLDRNMTEVRPLGFPGITPLPGYYGPPRLPAAAILPVMDSPQVLRPRLSEERSAPGLPGSSTDLSTRALPNHPGRPGGCLCSLLPRRWQASSPLEDWPPPFLCNEAESGLLSLGLTSSPSKEVFSLSPPRIILRDRPTSRVWLPCTEDRNYMLNEQLTCLTLLSQIDQPGLSWFTRGHRVLKP